MIAHTRRSRSTQRVMASLAACSMLSWVAPATASADEFWGLWASEIGQRTWWEMPFTIIVSFPAMVVTTPFWAGDKGVAALMNRGGNADAEDADAK